jgi:ABC-type Fe3+-hydroxamate transport system substrate-binding protein
MNDNLKRIADAVFSTEQLKRIADAMEEILRLVKKDMENIKEASK